jgi:hypothetical protein
MRSLRDTLRNNLAYQVARNNTGWSSDLDGGITTVLYIGFDLRIHEYAVHRNPLADVSEIIHPRNVTRFL